MGRPETRRPFYSRPGERRPWQNRPDTQPAAVSSSITITAAVLTFTGHLTGTLVCTLSSAPGDVTFTPADDYTIHAGSRDWTVGGANSAVVSGTTLTLSGLTAALGGADSNNYGSANDLFDYDGTDSTNLTNVEAVADLPITFTGGALVVPSGAWTISGNFAADAGQVAGSWSGSVTHFEAEGENGCTGETGSNEMAFDINPASMLLDGTSFAAQFISNGAAHVDAAQFRYTGTNADWKDATAGTRPIPPFIKALSP